MQNKSVYFLKYINITILNNGKVKFLNKIIFNTELLLNYVLSRILVEVYN